jgi:hypothetical protein
MYCMYYIKNFNHQSSSSSSSSSIIIIIILHARIGPWPKWLHQWTTIVKWKSQSLQSLWSKPHCYNRGQLSGYTCLQIIHSHSKHNHIDWYTFNAYNYSQNYFFNLYTYKYSQKKTLYLWQNLHIRYDNTIR